MKNIDQLTSILYPHTSEDPSGYSKKSGYTFKEILKNGEMAPISWIQVYKDDVLIAEIKESICVLHYNE